jgi:uncharacterized membrane protein YphA (DoxX/SURF4 family)
LQRLFSTFPRGGPGVGLLLLRICFVIALISLAPTSISETSSQTIGIVQFGIAAFAGLFLVVGLWTPVMGVVAALDEMWMAVTLDAPGQGGMWVHTVLAVLGVSVAMLGPGAWSIDARLFGRRRFDIDRRRGKRPSL